MSKNEHQSDRATQTLARHPRSVSKLLLDSDHYFIDVLYPRLTGLESYKNVPDIKPSTLSSLRELATEGKHMDANESIAQGA